MRGFIQIAQPHVAGVVMPDFVPLEEHFSEEAIADMMEELRLARQKALKV
jgi:hypothetical protein